MTDLGAFSPRLLAVFAHPDDESFSCGGLFASLTDRGVPITLVCATRGEVGQIRIEGLATRETLGAVRERELRTAMTHVGVDDIRFLGYRDSGMVGTVENDDPRAFVQAPRAPVVATLVELIATLRPTTVVTFGPDGFYGHPDHLRASELTTEAVRLAANGAGWPVAALYYATAPRERLQAFATRPQSPLAGMSPAQLATIGTPTSEITTILDMTSQIDRKRAAMMAHRTQFGDTLPFSDLPPEDIRRFLGFEHFVRVPLGWSGAPDADLLAD